VCVCERERDKERRSARTRERNSVRERQCNRERLKGRERDLLALLGERDTQARRVAHVTVSLYDTTRSV